jgi:hypothetical protein
VSHGGLLDFQVIRLVEIVRSELGKHPARVKALKQAAAQRVSGELPAVPAPAHDLDLGRRILRELEAAGIVVESGWD